MAIALLRVPLTLLVRTHVPPSRVYYYKFRYPSGRQLRRGLEAESVM